MNFNCLRNLYLIQLFLCFIVNCLILQAVDINTVLKSRERNTDYHIVITFGNHLAVRYFNITEMLRRQQCSGNHGKRNIYLFFLTVYLNGGLLIIGIGETDRHITGLANQILRRNLLSLQLIADGYIHRKLLICRTLIINIAAICIPYEITICIYCIGFISLNIHNIGQGGCILNGAVSVSILEAVTDNNLLCIALGICHDIYNLILLQLCAGCGGMMHDLIHDIGKQVIALIRL